MLVECSLCCLFSMRPPDQSQKGAGCQIGCSCVFNMTLSVGLLFFFLIFQCVDGLGTRRLHRSFSVRVCAPAFLLLFRFSSQPLLSCRCRIGL